MSWLLRPKFLSRRGSAERHLERLEIIKESLGLVICIMVSRRVLKKSLLSVRNYRVAPRIFHPNLIVMGRTPVYRTSNEREHHFSNIEQNWTSFFKHRTDTDIFINWWSNLNTLFLALKDWTSNFKHSSTHHYY